MNSSVSILGPVPNGRGCVPFNGSGIYAIHSPCGRTYVGQSKGVRGRLTSHRSALARGRHPVRRLQLAWDAVGGVGFEFAGLESAALSDLNARESYWMDYYNSLQPDAGFNVMPAPVGIRYEREAGPQCDGLSSKASRETFLSIYEIIRGCPDERGISVAEIKIAVGKSQGLVSAVLGELRKSGCVVGTQCERRLIRYSVAGSFPLSVAEKRARLDRIREIVGKHSGKGRDAQLVKQIKEILNGD